MRTLAIMQPYFLPYIGYWQLLHAVDQFVVYDNIQYTKKGWINRNRYLLNGRDETFSISLAKDSYSLDIRDRRIAPAFDRKKLLTRLQQAYCKAPFIKDHFPLFEEIVSYTESNLFLYLLNSIKLICSFLDIKTKIIISSSMDIDHSLKGESKIIAICKHLEDDNYINAIGGQNLYHNEMFSPEDITLSFLKTREIIYSQFANDFFPCLSIADILMFNSKRDIKTMLTEYDLI